MERPSFANHTPSNIQVNPKAVAQHLVPKSASTNNFPLNQHSARTWRFHLIDNRGAASREEEFHIQSTTLWSKKIIICSSAPVQPENVQLERLGFGSAPPAEPGDGRAPPADDVLRPLARPARSSRRPRIRHGDDNDSRVGKHTGVLCQ